MDRIHGPLQGGMAIELHDLWKIIVAEPSTGPVAPTFLSAVPQVSGPNAARKWEKVRRERRRGSL